MTTKVSCDLLGKWEWAVRSQVWVCLRIMCLFTSVFDHAEHVVPMLVSSYTVGTETFLYNFRRYQALNTLIEYIWLFDEYTLCSSSIPFIFSAGCDISWKMLNTGDQFITSPMSCNWLFAHFGRASLKSFEKLIALPTYWVDPGVLITGKSTFTLIWHF